MEKLLDACVDLIRLLPPNKVEAIVSRIRRSNATNANFSVVGVVVTPAAEQAVQVLLTEWQASNVTSNELSTMLLAAQRAFQRATSEQSIELVWTGPKTPFVAARRTEQALLQVINSAQRELCIVSFVAYDVTSITEAIQAACDRGVAVSILLESSIDKGGSLTEDPISRMRRLIPAARMYSWDNQSDEFVSGRVHAKLAVADSHTCFITSANLTDYAMERNMEAGVLIVGGIVPIQLSNHLYSLIEYRVLSAQ